MTAVVRIRMLGALELQQGERLITRFRYQKAAVLLAYLAYHAARPHPREQLIERFWPDLAPDAGRNNLSNILSSLRHQLEPPGTSAGAVLLADRFNIRLHPETVSTDVSDFEDRLRAAERSTMPMQQIQCLSDALDLYAGPLLPGYYEEWIVPEGRRLSDAFLQAARRLVRLLAKAGEADRALGVARRAITIDPLREEAHRDLMQLYVAMGQPSAALSQYRELERILEQELGQTPSAATRQLARDLQGRQSAEMPSIGGGVGAAAPPSARERPSSQTDQGDAAKPSSRPALPAESIPPSGTVTFLLLDLDEAAGQAGDLPADRGRWERQAVLLRHAFARGRGHVFQARSEGFGVAFSSATDALGCALVVLRQLEQEDEEPWHPGVSERDAETSMRAAAVLDASRQPRLVLHSGDVTPQDTAYSGPTLQRAQRLVLAGHQGQLLCSETTTALLRRELEQGVQLLDLGLYRLDRGAEVERVWQVAVTGAGSTTFPPLRAEPGTPSHLPTQLTRFFGRDAEIARLLALLKRPTPAAQYPSSALRLVTLTGPGGMGKTRLALEAGARLADAWEGAVWFASLADLADPAQIPSALVSTLGLPRSGAIEPLEQVVNALNARPTLLILDNFEQLVEAGADTVRMLLQRAPTLTCLVTSRQRLEIAGEHEVALAPLAVPTIRNNAACGRKSVSAQSANRDLPTESSAQRLVSSLSSAPLPDLPSTILVYESVQLFVDRAQAVKPDFQVRPNNAGAIAALCAGLEGIPLALELAASRAQVLTPAQMLEQLQDRFTFLVSRRRDAAARHRTLLSTVEWSYRLLPPELCRVFGRLSVFRGGWDLAAAEAVCENLDLEPLDALAQLRECSLILTEENAAGQMRFRMLETLREYAQRRLRESGEEEAIHIRHADYYLALAEQADACLAGPEQGPWLDRLEMEHDNLRAALSLALKAEGERDSSVISFPSFFALRLAGALGRFWHVRGYLDEGRSWLREALKRQTAAIGNSHQAKALHGVGVLAYAQGDFEAAREFHEESLALRRNLEDRAGIANSLNGLAIVADDQGDYKTAGALHEESLALMQELGDQVGTAQSLHNLGNVAVHVCDYETARTLYQESLAIAREAANLGGIGRSISCLANLARIQGDYASARTLYEESLSIAQGLGNKRGIAATLNNLGAVADALGDGEAARIWYENSLAMVRELDDRAGTATSLNNLGNLARKRGDYKVARELSEESLILRRALGDRSGIAASLNSLAMIEDAQGDYATARQLYEESVTILRELGDKASIAVLVVNLAELANDQGDYATAHRLSREGLSLFDEIGDKRGICRALEASASAAAARGSVFQAARLWGAAEALREAFTTPLNSVDRTAFERSVEQARGQADENEFAEAWEQGRAMTLEQIVRYVLDDL